MTLPRVFLSSWPWRSLLLIWAGILFWLSEQSHLPSPASFDGIDKLEHAVFFAAGGMCFLLALRLSGRARSVATAVTATVLFCSTIGALDEWHQTFTPGRSGGDVWDWSADTFGGFIGAWLALGAHMFLLTSAGTATSESP